MGMTVGKLKEYLNNFDDRETVYYFDSEYGEDVPFSAHYITISDNFKEKEDSANNIDDAEVANRMRGVIENHGMTLCKLREYLNNHEMTIEQIIKYLPAPMSGATDIGKEMQKYYDAHDLAVIILRKYQKIEQIIDDWEHDVYPTSDDALDDVERVLEYGKID